MVFVGAGSMHCFRCTLNLHEGAAPGWRNWQTQRTQNPPRATSWGFDPPSRHQDKIHKMNRLQRPKPLSLRGFFMPKSAGDTSGDTLLFWFRRDTYAEATEESQGSLG